MSKDQEDAAVLFLLPLKKTNPRLSLQRQRNRSDATTWFWHSNTYFDIYWTVCVFDFLFGAVCSIYRSSVNADWAQKIEPACLWGACSETLPFRRRFHTVPHAVESDRLTRMDSFCSGGRSVAILLPFSGIQGWPCEASRVPEISIPEFHNSAMPRCSFITKKTRITAEIASFWFCPQQNTLGRCEWPTYCLRLHQWEASNRCYLVQLTVGKKIYLRGLERAMIVERYLK